MRGILFALFLKYDNIYSDGARIISFFVYYSTLGAFILFH